MKKNYAELIRRVNERSNPQSKVLNKMFADSVSGSKLFENLKSDEAEVAIYIKKAMEPVAPEFTNNSKVAANKVQEQLRKSHGSQVHFEKQGSVMTDTHIMKDHDVDLVQITNKSSQFDKSGLDTALANPSKYKPEEVVRLKKHKANFNAYIGDQKSDLAKLRLKSEEALEKAYKYVDCDGDKSILVTTTEPHRKIDVVTAVYYKGVDYMRGDKVYRKGIQIYDKRKDDILKVDYPFWSIRRMNMRHIESNERFKLMIRFLKNIKFEHSEIDNKGAIRSFHLNGICYNILVSKYKDLNYIDLVSILHAEFGYILTDENYRNGIMSVDGSESIFAENTIEKLREIKLLHEEMDSLLADLNLGNQWIG